MKYKLVIYGNNMYKDVIIDDSFSGSLTIGTDKACQIAFRRERFKDGFIFRIDKQAGDNYIISCSDTIYLKADSEFKEYIRQLELGDHIALCYDCNDMEFFYVDFLAFYDQVGTDYDVAVDVAACNEFSVGGRVDCIVRVDDPYMSNDSIKIRRAYDCYEIDWHEAHIGVELNGFALHEDIGVIYDGEFFSIKGHSFCIDKGILYTSKQTKLITNQKVTQITYQSNHYEYPKYIKNVRQKFELPSESIEILNPKNKEEKDEQSFLMSVMPMLVNMLLMVGMRGVMGGGGMFVIYFAATMSVSTTITIINFCKDKKKRTEKEDRRKKVYMEYLSKQEDEIIKLREREKIVANYMNPDLDTYVKFVDEFDNRLFEKNRNDNDYLKIRIGSGVVASNCQVDYKKEDYVDTDDELKDFPQIMHDKYQYISSMPVCLDIKDVNAVGFIGKRNKLYQMGKNLIIEYAASHFYKDVKMFMIMDEEDVSLFEWARWMKITYSEAYGMRNFMYDKESAKTTLEFLYSELSRREAMGAPSDDMPEYIVLVYKSSAISTHPVSKYIDKANDLGFRFIFFEEYEEYLNSECSTRIFLSDKGYSGYIQDVKDGESIQKFDYTHISGEAALNLSKKLGAVCFDEVSLENTLTKNITLFKLLGIMNPYDLNLGERWSKSEIYKSMAAPIGVKSGDEIVYLDLHEKYHGPHGLVAGTTGSGKSEILQTYILSMATLFHPYEVGFIIIDFKGGGMVNQFRDLPHLNGAITNIDGNEIERSLLSIKAELIKRQELFAEQDVNHIDEYIKKYKDGSASVPLPHLILIVDEFAELKSEQPEFMKELISAARIGRSLGVHLILATQKPAGVVSDQIWSNSKFKLCLKVQNKGDSNEVLKSPLAAEITEPGRAYLQVGNNEIFQLFQSAYSGAMAQNDGIAEQKKFNIAEVALSGRRKIIYEQKPTSNDGGETQLKALVNYINEYCDKKNINKLPDICLPSLAEVIPITVDGFEYDGTDVVVPVGITDDPSRQKQYVEVFNVSQNNIYILGSSQSGKTNLIQTMIRNLTDLYSPKEVNIYILDFASMVLRNFRDLNHVGGVITVSDEERLKGFLKLIQATMLSRKARFSEMGISSFSAYRETGRTDIPQIVVFLDNWIAFKNYFNEYEEPFINISRECVSVGISLVITSNQAGGVGYKLLPNFSKRTALYCNDSGDYNSVFDSCRKKINDISGRGIVESNKTLYECQYYLAFAAEKEFEKIKLIKEYISYVHEKYGDIYVPGIPEIPEKVTDSFLNKQFGTECCAAYEVPLGMEFNSIGLRTIKLNKTTEISFLGKQESHKHAYVEYLLDRVLSRRENEPVELFIVDNAYGEYRKYSEMASMYTNNGQDIVGVLERVDSSSSPFVLCMINSIDVLKAVGTDKEMAARYKSLVTNGRGKVCFMYTDVENSTITFGSGDVLKHIKDNKNLVAFEDIGNIKAMDIPIDASRRFKKPLDKEDAYLFEGIRVEKIRVMSKEER